MNSKDNKVIVVLGMHRSGTSAIAGTLSYIGVDFGAEEKLIGSLNDSNAKGHWEHREIVMFNEQLLTHLESQWDDFRIIEKSSFNTNEIINIKEKILEVLKSDFNHSGLWGLKDPRICKLLPFWNDIFQELGVTPVYVIIFRHPDEVSNSLMKRNGFAIEKSHLLWLSHILLAEKYSRSSPRLFISYDNLLNDWNTLVDKLNNCPGIVLNADKTKTDNISNFLSPELRHTIICNQNSENDNSSWSYDIYNDMNEFSTGNLKEDSFRNRLDSIYTAFTIADSLYSSLIYDQSSAYNEIRILQKDISNMTIEYENIRKAYNLLESAYKQTQQAYEQVQQAYELRDKELQTFKNNFIYKLMMKWKKITGF